uniref:Protein quiver n=1 Tax=Panagrellus redivivus TaxID=6233 RepID=A0A7E4ZUH5_PANRE
MAKVLAFLAVICLLPVLIAAIRCLKDNSGNIYDNCNYCGFAKFTMYNGGGVTQQTEYQCLQVPVLTAWGGRYSTDRMNQCYQVTENGQYPMDVELYLCNGNNCNTRCDASSVGLGFASLLGAALLTYLTQM